MYTHKATGCPEKRAGYCCRNRVVDDEADIPAFFGTYIAPGMDLQGDLKGSPKVISALHIEMHRRCKWGVTVLGALSASYNLQITSIAYEGSLQTRRSSDVPLPAPPLPNPPCLRLYMHWMICTWNTF